MVLIQYASKTTPGTYRLGRVVSVEEDKDKLVVVYCGFTACGRSHNAALWAKRNGYTNVKRYPGGIFAWKGAGLPTVAVEP